MIRAADILPLAEYERQRGRLRDRAMSARAARRLQLGPHASLVFENVETIRYQIQEILRAERISDPDAIGQEIAEWFETLARAERSHAGRFQRGLDSLGK